MTRSELKEKIKNIAKQVYSGVKSSNTSQIVDLDVPSNVSLDVTRFPALEKFPTLKDTIIKLLTDQYDLFIKDIEWVAPRPTTFRIILANDQAFYLIYTDRTWISKVEGKKYYLLNISEEQNCIESIARILSYGTKASLEKETQPPVAPETPLVPEEPAPETPPEEIPPQA
jgi:hypothetical protein